MSLMRHIPNLLTYLRLLLIPVFVLLLIDPSPGMVWAALVVFTIAALTDYFDGMVARRFQVVSDTGKLLDPLADKILVMAAFIMLVGLRADTDGNPWVPPWMVVMVLAREIWVTGLRGVAAARGTVVAAGGAGKWKTTFQMLSIAALLVHYKHELFGIVIDFKVSL